MATAKGAEGAAEGAAAARAMFRDQTVLEDKYIREYAFEPELLIKRDGNNSSNNIDNNNNNNSNDNDTISGNNRSRSDAAQAAADGDGDGRADRLPTDGVEARGAPPSRHGPSTHTRTSTDHASPSPSPSAAALLTSSCNEHCVRRYSGDIYDEISSRNQVDLEIEAFYYVSVGARCRRAELCKALRNGR